MIRVFCLLLTVVIADAVSAQQSVQLHSPDKKITCVINTGKSGVAYRVLFNKKVVVNLSQLSIVLQDGFTLKNTSALKPLFKDSVEIYDLLTGRASHVESHYSQVTIPLQEKNNGKRIINLIFRAFNDGIAFRYQITSAFLCLTLTGLEPSTTAYLPICSGLPLGRGLLRSANRRQGAGSSYSHSKSRRPSTADRSQNSG